MPKAYNHEKSEWSHLVNIDDIDSEPKTHSFKATKEQCVDLARRFGLISIESAQASVTLARAGGGVIHAMGTVRADVTQSCVVSLKPVAAHVEDEFEGWFGDKTQAVSFAKAKNERDVKKTQAEVEILEESVDPEPIINGKVDIGELATQYLSLALPPYPRAEGVASSYEFGPKPSADDKKGEALRKNPFEALKDWKEKR